MNNFKFGNPWLLFLLIPLIGGVVLGYFLMGKGKRNSKKNVISFSLHLVMAVLVSFAFADPQFLESGRPSEVLILADASASESPSIERMDASIKKARSEALRFPNTEVGVVAFAKDSRFVTEFGKGFDSLSEVYEDGDFDYSASDLEQALLFAAESFSEQALKRVVLISDGVETDGSAIDALSALMAEGIQIDTLSLQADFPSEISLTGLEYTDNAYLNRAESVQVAINATEPSDATIELYRNGVLDASQFAYLGNGLNLVSFDLDTAEEGEAVYRVVVKARDGYEFHDSFAENNTRSFVQRVTGDFSILFLGTSESELSEFVRLGQLSEETKIDSYIGASEVPYTLEELIEYDEIVLSDIDLTKIAHYDEFVDNLTVAVRVYGKSVFTFSATHVGDENDPSLIEYNDLLPVQYQPDDSRAMVLLIDSSGSMGGNNIDMAKAGAKAVVDKLSINDSIAIVTFETNVQIPVAMTTIRDEANRADIKAKIDHIDINGGTNMLNGLTEAYKQIDGVTAEYKNIITLSDGLPGDNPDDLKEFVTSMSFSNISSSFINIGDPEGEEVLKTLAKLGNGKYYYIDSALGLKDIMIDSIDQEVVNAIIEKDSEIIYQLEDDPSLQGGVYNNLDNISGYAYCRMKTGANTVLSVQYIHTNSDNELSVIAVPLYAYWDFGRGRVSSFTSSLNTSWTAKLRGSAAGQLFFKNIIAQSFPERFNKSTLDLELIPHGSSSSVIVTPNLDSADARINLTATPREGGEPFEAILTYDGTTFQGEVATPEPGLYDLRLVYSRLNPDNGLYEEEETLDYVYSFDYSSEFNFFDDQPTTLLYELSSQSGGRQLAEEDIRLDISDSQLQQASYSSSMVWLLLSAVIVYLIDIFVRKTTFRKKPAKMDSEPPANFF